jgi:peptidoglycan/LPS O-acetylase OafA/YrhL
MASVNPTRAEPHFASPDAPAHLSHLDGLRGLAALWVLVAHCMIWGGWYWPHLPSAKLAVDIFMMISGYLMIHQMHRRAERESPREGRTWLFFFIRRFFRIAPVYYMTLAIACFLQGPFLAGYQTLRDANPGWWHGDVTYDPKLIHFTIENVIVHVLFVFGAWPTYCNSTMTPDWSIGLEMQFYACFPLLVITAAIGRWYIPLALAAIGAPLISTWMSCMPGIRPGMHGLFAEPSFLPLKVDVFMIGMVAAEAVRRLDSDRLRAGTLALFLLLVTALSHPVPVLLAAWLLLHLGDTGNRDRITGLVRSVFAARTMRFLADSSYAVYLFHGFAIALLGGWLWHQDGFLALPASTRVRIVASGNSGR